MDNVIEGEIKEEQPLTPIPREQGKSITMDFPDAIREIGRNKKVRRMSWPEEDYGLLNDGWLSIYTKGKFHTWSVSDGDFEGQDWYVVREKN